MISGGNRAVGPVCGKPSPRPMYDRNTHPIHCLNSFLNMRGDRKAVILRELADELQHIQMRLREATVIVSLLLDRERSEGSF